VQESGRECKPQEISNSLYGLQRMRDSYELRQVLVALTPKVHHCNEEFTSQAIGNALYGMRNMSDCPEVRALISALTPKIERSRAVMKPQEIGNALYGLQSIGGSSEELRKLLRALTPKVKQCRETFLAQHITNAFQGLHLIDDSEELKQLLLALRPKVQYFSEDLSRRFVNTTLDWLERRKGSAALCADLASKVQPIHDAVPPPGVNRPYDADYTHVQRHAYDNARSAPEKSGGVHTATHEPISYGRSEDPGPRRPFVMARTERL
jgi:hypothetical protein